MFKDDYKAAFSKVTASEDAYRRVMCMTKESKKQHHSVSFASKVLLAAVLISMLTITVTAAEYVHGWFTTYFSEKSEMPLSEEQVEFVEENVQNIDQSKTNVGYMLTVKSAITDGRMAYVTVGVTAPGDVVLNTTAIEGYAPDAPTILFNAKSGNPVFTDADGRYKHVTVSGVSMEDNDGQANTQDILFTIDVQDAGGDYPFDSGVKWEIHVDDIIAEYRNTAYMDELLSTKYAGQENFMLTEEEGEKANPKKILAEGNWEYTFSFENSSPNEMELISEPVAARTVIGWKADGSVAYQDVKIVSFKLRPLGATILCEYDLGAPDFSDNEKQIHAVMKDGTSAVLRSSSGGPGEQVFEADSPIILGNVDYVLLGDGTQISIP